MLLNSWTKHLLTLKNWSSIQKARRLNRTHFFLLQWMLFNEWMINKGCRVADSLWLWPSKESHQSICFSGRNPPPTTLWCWGTNVSCRRVLHRHPITCISFNSKGQPHFTWQYQCCSIAELNIFWLSKLKQYSKSKKIKSNPFLFAAMIVVQRMYDQ